MVVNSDDVAEELVKKLRAAGFDINPEIVNLRRSDNASRSLSDSQSTTVSRQSSRTAHRSRQKGFQDNH